MKYYHIVSDGIHKIVRFDNNGKVYVASLMSPVPDGEDERKILPEHYSEMVEVSDGIKDIVSNGKLIYEFWIPGLTEKEYEELKDFATEYDSPEDFIEGYLSAGYEYWTDTCPEKDDPDNRYEQEVYGYLERAWEAAQKE